MRSLRYIVRDCMDGVPAYDDPPASQRRVTPVVRVRTFWVVVSPQTKVAITCALYRTPDGLELRAGQGEQDQLLVQKVVGNASAEAFAAAWHRLAQAKGYQDAPPAPERPLRARILEWLWGGHADITHRTPAGIAAMVHADEHSVRRELSAMVQAGLIRVLPAVGYDAYYPGEGKG